MTCSGVTGKGGGGQEKAECTELTYHKETSGKNGKGVKIIVVEVAKYYERGYFAHWFNDMVLINLYILKKLPVDAG